MSKTDDNNIWLYNASFPLACLVAIIYSIPFTIQSYQTILKHRSWYFLPVVIGAALEVGGYIARAVSIKHPSEIPPFAISSSFIVLAPVFLAAGNYLLITRLITSVLRPTHTTIFRLRAVHITRTFVLCDIISFLIQVAGTSVASSNNWAGDTVRVGENVLIAGLSTQVATFCVFLGIVGRFHAIARVGGTVREDAPKGWVRLLRAIYVSSALILIRSIYRVVEFGCGIFGYPFTHEWMFYVFESLPMLPAIAVFCVYHPAKILGRSIGTKNENQSSVADLGVVQAAKV